MMMRLSRILALAAVGFLLSGTTWGGTIYNGWNYAIDSLDDATGGKNYEIRGMAIRDDGKNLYVAISTGFPLGGNVHTGTLNGKISMGDIYFNFSSHNLSTAAKFNDPKVFGIRFSADNDSFNNTSATPNTTLGVFSNITTASLSSVNLGHTSLQNYINTVGPKTPLMGDLVSGAPGGDVIQYLGNGKMQTNMTSGTKIGDITLLDRTALTGLGLDFGHFPGVDPVGNFVYGFSLDRSLFPNGDFTAHFFEECINDGIAIKGTLVPEPSSMIALGTAVSIGLLATGVRKVRGTSVLV